MLPDPGTYASTAEFAGDLACVRAAGYDAVELQVADPAELDESGLRTALRTVGLPLCAFQTGATYATRGNCLCTRDDAVRGRTIELLRSFVDFATRWRAVMVFGSLQGRSKDEPNRQAGTARIAAALAEVGDYAGERDVTLALEPVNHGEVGFHNTIAEAAERVRVLNRANVRLMVDTFHMNIEERDMTAPLLESADLLVHVHLSETNRNVLGTGHWDTRGFLATLARVRYGGYCSVGVYNTRQPRRACIARCMEVLRAACGA